MIAEHLEAAGDLHAAYGWHMRAATWSTYRDIAAAHVSWERARKIADAMPEDDPNRLTMRIAPRTLMCAHGYRVHTPIAGTRFEELQELCTTAGDKASLAIGMAGLIGDYTIARQHRKHQRLAFELTALLESIGEPTLTVGLAISPMCDEADYRGYGRDAAVSRKWSSICPIAIRPEGNSLWARRWRMPTDHGRSLGGHRAMGLARRLSTRPDDVAKYRSACRRAPSSPITYGSAIYNGVVLADDVALRDIQEALDIAERSADDLALGFALLTHGQLLWS